MKITDIRVVPVGIHLDETLRWGSFQVSIKGGVLVFIDTDEGITGIGEAGTTVHLYARLKPVLEYLKPCLIGKDPTRIEELWHDMYKTVNVVSIRGLETYAMSGIDIALWDILGKFCGMPVYKLLGAYQDKVKAYWAPSLKPAKVVERECKEALKLGFKAAKIRVGISKTEDLNIVKTARKVLGEDAVLMVDANMAYDLTDAVEMAKRFEEYSIYWLEEPVLGRGASNYADLHERMQAAVNVRLAGGESIMTKYDFNELICRRVFDVVQPDCAKVGGITECRKIGTMAESHGLDCVPHIGCGSFGAVNLAANMQVICSLSNSPFVEFDAYDNPIRTDAVRPRFTLKDGFLEIPQGPGIGI